jgi:hypothetical protein
VVEAATKTHPDPAADARPRALPRGRRPRRRRAPTASTSRRAPPRRSPPTSPPTSSRSAASDKLASLRSEHEGPRPLRLHPRAGREATSCASPSPSGIRTTVYPLPESKGSLALRSEQDVTAGPQRPPSASPCSSSADRQGARRPRGARARAVGARTVTPQRPAARPSLALDGGDGEGVLTATAYDDKGAPLAERLVYRKPAKALTVELVADKKTYVPWRRGHASP